MQLIILDRSTLCYKDNGFVSDEFELIVDLVIPQKSYFVVNKERLNVIVSDIVVIKEKNYSYVGIVETIETKEKGKTKIQTKDYKDLFSVKIPVHNYNGDVCIFLKECIENQFKYSNDIYQNLNYLKIDVRTSIDGHLNFDEDTLIPITDLIELITKTYGINMHYEIGFIRGRFSEIKIIIDSTHKGIKLKSNYKEIRELVINDSDEQIINKVIFYPKSDNTSYQTIISFYLLTNGDITTEADNPNRFKSVSCQTFFYSDNEYQTLETKARSEMIKANLDHNITFLIRTDNSVIKPLENIFLGDFIEFITEDKTYDTVVTQFKYKSSFKEVAITLGEYRIKLTEKIKLLSKNNSASSSVSITKSQSENIDGGEF